MRLPAALLPILAALAGCPQTVKGTSATTTGTAPGTGGATASSSGTTVTGGATASSSGTATGTGGATTASSSGTTSTGGATSSSGTTTSSTTTSSTTTSSTTTTTSSTTTTTTADKCAACSASQLCVVPGCTQVFGEECIHGTPDAGTWSCPPGTQRGQQFDLDCLQPGYACVSGCPPAPPFCVDLPAACTGVPTCGCLASDPCHPSNSGACHDADIVGNVLTCSLKP